MGLYYNPNPPHIGAQQPLDQKKLTPPQSGPPPQNPPFNGGARLAQGILTAWAVAAAVGIPCPPLVARNLNPPISGPVPQNPPFAGTRVSTEVQVSWLPAPPTPWPNFVADDAAPLIPAAVATTPLFKRLDYAIYSAWIVPPPLPIVAANLDPPVGGQNPPFNGGASVPAAVQISWLPLPPAPIVAVNLDPPLSGPVSQNPPFAGTRVSVEVQVAWLPPVLLPILAINMDPPVSGPVPYVPPGPRGATEIQLSWITPAPTPWPNFVANDTAPLIPGPVVTYTPVGSRVPVEVQVAWLPAPYQPYLPANLDPPISGPAPQNPPFAGTRLSVEVQVAWLPPAPAPITVRNNIPISAPTVAYTPVGAQIPVAVQVSWLPLPPAPIVAVNLVPPISGPVSQNPPFVGTRVSAEVQISWLPAPTTHWPNFVADDFAPLVPALVVTYTPIGSFVPAAVQIAWLPVVQAPQFTPARFTPSAPGFPFPGSSVPSALWSWWREAPPLPLVRLLRPVSGPAPSQPPPGGGSVIRQEVLVRWVPLPPDPILASKGGVIGTFGFTFTPSWRVAVVPAKAKVVVIAGQPIITETAKSKVAVVAVKNKVAVSLPPNQVAVPPRGR